MPVPLSIIIVGHNEIEYTKACIEHIRKFTGGAHEMIFVDNGSTDGTEEFLRTVPGAIVMRNEENLGLARAANQGAARASGDVLVFLHNDVLVSKGWSERLVRALNSDDMAALAGPRSNEASGVQRIPAPFGNIKALQRFAFDFARENDGKVFEVGALSSFCLAVKRRAFEAIGPFDEGFHSTWFEEDYAVRAKKSGFKLLCGGDVFVYHFGGQTFRGKGMSREATFSLDRNTYLKKWSRKKIVALIAGEGREALDSLKDFIDGAIVIRDEPGPGEEFQVRTIPPIHQELEGSTWNRLLAAAGDLKPDWVLLLKEGEIPERALAKEIHNLTNPENVALVGYSFTARAMAHRNYFFESPSLQDAVPVLFRFCRDLMFSDEIPARIPQGIDEAKIAPSKIRLKRFKGLTESPDPDAPVRPWNERTPLNRKPDHRQRMLNLLPVEGRRFLFLTDDPEWWAFLLKSWGREEVCAVKPEAVKLEAVTPETDTSEEPASVLEPPKLSGQCPSVNVLVQGDPETVSLPFCENHFDVIVFDDLLNRHLRPGDLLKRYRPYLRNSGVILANAFNHGNMDCVAGFLLDDWRYEEGGLPDYGHVCFLTLDGVKEIMKDAGLPIVFLEGRTAMMSAPARKILETLRDAGYSLSAGEGSVTQYIVAACRDREACAFTGQEKSPTLSLCMIAKNEEVVLARCLESVRGVADEIILVDTGSTDRTVEIARRYGAKVSFFEWTKDFSEARNVALGLATSDWILVLDADEVLDPSSAILLKRILQIGGKPGVVRMYFLREISYYNADGQTEQAAEHKNLRLFPNLPAIRYRGKIHEQVVYEGDLPAERLTTPLIIHHYGYMSTELDRKDRNERNLELLRKAIEENPDEPFHKYNMGCQLYFAGRHPEALKYFDEVIEKIPPGSSSGYLPMSYVLAAVCLDQMKKPAEAVGRLRKILESVPSLADAHYHLGRILTSLGAIEEAERHLHLAISAQTEFSDYLGNFDISTTTWKPLVALGILKTRQGKWEEALDYFYKACTHKPDEEGVWAYIGQCFLHLGRFEKAHEYYAKVHEMSPGRVDFFQEWAKSLISLGRNEEAARIIEMYLRAQGQGDPAIARVLAKEGLDREALKCLDKYIEKNQYNYEAWMLRGTIFLRSGDHRNALRDLQRSVELNPESAGAHNNLGAILARMGDHGGAREHYLLAASVGTGRAEALYNLIEADLAMGGVRKVEEDLPFIFERLERCAESDPQSPEISGVIEKLQSVMPPGEQENLGILKRRLRVDR